MWQTLLYEILKFVVTRIFTKELVGYVIENVQFYMTDETMDAQMKKDIVLQNMKEKAKEIGVEVTSSASNMILETAVAYVKSKL